MSATRYQTFLSVPPRLEWVLDEELRSLGFKGSRSRLKGGAELYVSEEELWSLCHDSRIPEHIRVRIGDFHAATFREFEHGFFKLPFAAYYDRGAVPPVEVTTERSKLYHSDAVKQRAERFLGEFLDANRGHDESLPTLYVRLVNNVCVVSVDVSGERLHKRGIRTYVGDAPLRETLAAACLRAAEMQDAPVLYDPFCGSGAFLIERAIAEQGLRLPRSFAFERWKNHDADAYTEFLKDRDLVPKGKPTLVGSEKSKRAMQATRANLDNIRRLDGAILAEGDFREQVSKVPEGASVITNPPWGVRMSNQKKADIAAEFGGMLRERPDFTEVAVLTADTGFERETGFKWREVMAFKDGGIDVRLLKLKR
jgi:putative N6-adenine-specific DNA methylase